LDRNLAISSMHYLTQFPRVSDIVVAQALFDVFLFILTIFNAASRPRRANVKIITDLRRDGCVFYLVRACCYLWFTALNMLLRGCSVSMFSVSVTMS
jgi:hypothetical protein